MKRLIFLCALIMMSIQHAGPAELDNFQVLIEPKWQNLEHNSQQSELFKGKWLLVGSITFKKKSKDPVNLTKLELRWKGESSIEDLLGSLYRKNPDKDFMPIQEYLVCDGSWNKTQQLLKLTFDRKETLGLINTFYLVLTIPESLEPLLKKGSFEIVQHSLPEPFRLATLPTKLSLSLDVIDATVE